MAAKLLHPFLLCNDINLKTLISVIKYDEEHILITCKYFIKRFNLVNKKQVNSWVTKCWHPFTGGAVKNPQDGCMCAIIGQSSICQWSLEDKDIESSKKYVFKSPVHSLATGKNSIYLIYTCGFVESISKALKTRRHPKAQIVGNEETILCSQIFEEQKEAAILTRHETSGITKIYKLKIGSNSVVCLNLSLRDLLLTGSTITTSGDLLSSWSDGNLYCINILRFEHSHPGVKKGKLSALQPTRNIKILELSPNHIALQGMKVNEEGGIVILFDIKFGVCVSSKSLKMYTDPPLAWSVPSGVVVGDGGYLMNIPISLSPSTVASMLGSHSSETEMGYDVCLSWKDPDQTDNIKAEVCLESSIQTLISNKSNALAELILQFNLGGCSEHLIADKVVNKVIEAKNLELMLECIESFSFLAETSMTSILKFLIARPDEHFEKTTSSVPSEMVACPFSAGKRLVINKILVMPFTESELSRALSMLDFNVSLALIEYLNYLLTPSMAQMLPDDEGLFPTMENVSCWLSLVLDANYNQLVLTPEAEIHRKLLNVLSNTTYLCKLLEDSRTIDVLLERILTSKQMPKTHKNSPYSIEKLSFS